MQVESKKFNKFDLLVDLCCFGRLLRPSTDVLGIGKRSVQQFRPFLPAASKPTGDDSESASRHAMTRIASQRPRNTPPQHGRRRRRTAGTNAAAR